MICPRCMATSFCRAGFAGGGRQRLRCKGCGHEFVAETAVRRILPETEKLIRNLLAEGVSVPLLARASGVERSRLYRMRRRER